MKKVLFVIGSAGAGGTMTSLFNLLSLIDKEKIEAHLLLQKHTGVLISRAKEFNLLPEEKVISSLTKSKSELKGSGFFSYFIRGCYAIMHRIFGVRKANKFFYKKSAKKFNNKYDVVVAYQEGFIADYAQHIQAPKHVAWCHMDYKAFAVDDNQEEYWKNVYSKYSRIACVSEVVLKSMVEVLGYPRDNIGIVYNTIPAKFILGKAEEKCDIKKSTLTFVSSGRYVQRKRFDRFVAAAEKLKQSGVEFIWYLLGNGENYSQISAMIKEKNLQDELIQVGAVENPFVYYKVSDCFVMASESEGQPMVLNEALTLGVPVITTEFPSAKEVVEDGKYGIIVPNDDLEFVKGVCMFAEDKNLRDKIKASAKTFVYNNEAILNQVYSLLGV